MPPFLYPPLATALLSYSDLLIDHGGSHSVALADATEARSNLRNALKEVASGATEWLPVLDAAQSYLPHLYGLIGSLEVDDLLPRGDTTFLWQSALTARNLPGSSSLIPLATFHSELLFTLVCLATALSNHARTVVKSVVASISTNVVDSATEKGRVDKFAQAVDLLCRASGVFEHVCDKVLPAWDVATRNASSDSKKGKAKMPVECSREVLRGLAIMAMADAHAIAVQKLLSPFHTSVTMRPSGPPLARGHPSPSLLAKLYLHIASLYINARSLVKTVQSSSNDSVVKNVEVDATLLDYLRKEGSIAEAAGRKWLGVEAGEAGKVGLALAWLADARSRLEGGGNASSKLKDKLKIAKKEKDKKERRGRIEDELDEIEAFRKVYKQMNDTVSFQPLVAAGELQSLLPAGRPIVQVKPYSPPSPAFGPGSIGYVHRHRSETEEEDADAAAKAPEAASGSYAGSGRYY